MAFFTEQKQIILKVTMEKQKTLKGQNSLEEDEQTWRYNGGIMRPDLQLYYILQQLEQYGTGKNKKYRYIKQQN